ncbi:hypothetical protein ACW14Y_11610 [Kitasatospora sp. cg17-2]
MSETMPNSKGPAERQLSPEQMASLGMTPVPEATEPTLIPADQVKPEDLAALAIEYRDGWPVIVVNGGGTVIPAELPVLGPDGAVVRADSVSIATARYKYSGKEEFDGLYYFGAR